MNPWTPLIQGTELLAVTYTTEAPDEKVHPWVSWEPDFNDYKVSLFKKPVPLTAFLTRLACHEPGLRSQQASLEQGHHEPCLQQH